MKRFKLFTGFVPCGIAIVLAVQSFGLSQSGVFRSVDQQVASHVMGGSSTSSCTSGAASGKCTCGDNSVDVSDAASGTGTSGTSNKKCFGAGGGGCAYSQTLGCS